MPIKFLKPQEKLKKNLNKEFQTFNHNQGDQMSEHSPKYESHDVKHSHITDTQHVKSLAHQQLTTQTKSPLVKSASGSKAQLHSHKHGYNQTNQLSYNKSLKSSKKSLHQSLSKARPLTPAQELPHSRQSSPEPQRVYSKMSTYDKRTHSKLSNYKNVQGNNNPHDHQATYAHKNTSKASFSSKLSINQKPQTHKKKHISVTHQSSQKVSTQKTKKFESKQPHQSQTFQISFPQMVTESEPTSSHPNTAKQSTHRHRQQIERKRNSNITEEEENSAQDQSIVEDDYIQQNGLGDNENEQNMAGHGSDEVSQNHLMEVSNAVSGTGSNIHGAFTGYSQLPNSYLIAMEVLQAKLLQQENTIKKLKQKAIKNEQKYKTLQNDFQALKTTIQDQNLIISQKDAQIKFLKGYLDQQKYNNRQALKQVAKNVYERSISGKKYNQNNPYLQDQSRTKQKKKTKKQLFAQGDKENHQKDQQKQAKMTENESENGEERDQINFNQEQFEANSNEEHEKTEQTEKNDQINREKQQKPDKSTQPKINKSRIKSSPRTESKQLQLAQQKRIQEQLIKDQLMRQQIIREQAAKAQKSTETKYDHLQRSRNSNNRSLSVKEAYPYTVKKLQKQDWELSGRKDVQNGEKELYSEGKRVRSMSTAIKYLEEGNNPNLTYRPRQGQKSSVMPQYSYHGGAVSVLNPSSKQSVLDPVLQRYIQAKSDISSYRFPNQTGFFKDQGSNLKSEKRHRQTVSGIREILREEREVVALNYRLEAIQKRILECVKSGGREVGEQKKTLMEQTEDKILLEELHKQYSVLKKELERKEVIVRELKMKGEGQRQASGQ